MNLPKRISITLNYNEYDALNRLRSVGLFGRSASAIAHQFIDDGLQKAIKDGWILDSRKGNK